jgi:hypothetical protein
MHGVSQQYQIDSFPDRLPGIIVRYWLAHERWYAAGKLEPPTREQFEGFLRNVDPAKAFSRSSVDRARKRYPRLMPWPVTRGMPLPWIAHPEVLAELDSPVSADGHQQLELLAADGQAVPVRIDDDGLVHVIKRWQPYASLVASLLVLHWCGAVLPKLVAHLHHL